MTSRSTFRRRPAPEVPSAQQRLDALYRADCLLIEGYRAQIRQLQDEPQRIFRSMVKGELTIYGKPVQIEWPEGRPFGWTDEELLSLFPADEV